MKKSDLKLIIRKIVREEVAMAIQEVITELKKPTQQVVQSKQKHKNKIVEKKSFSSNSVLNDVLNETAGASEEWEQLGGGTFDSSRMNEVISSQYSDTMNGSQQVAVNPNDPMAQFLNKDYRQVLQKVDEKAKQTRG